MASDCRFPGVDVAAEDNVDVLAGILWFLFFSIVVIVVIIVIIVDLCLLLDRGPLRLVCPFILF